MSSPTPKVAIIGCGLAGPILALKLKESNVPCTIFELRPSTATPEGGHLMLAPNALRILDSLNIYEQIRAQGFNFQTVNLLSGRTLARLGTVANGGKARYGYDALRVSRHALRSAILEELKSKGIEVRYEYKCVGIEERDDGVLVTFANGHIEHASVVVGADGIHSRVREFLAPGTKPVFSGQIGIGGSLDRNKMHPAVADMHLPAMVLGKANSCMMMPTSYDGQRVGCFVTVEGDEMTREQITNVAVDKEHLAKQVRESTDTEHGWPELVAAAGRDLEPASLNIWPFFAVPKLDSWMSASGSCILIGDAIHAIPPTGGQGAAQAFEDAASLGEALKMMFDAETDETARLRILRAWETHRKDRIQKIMAMTKRGGDVRKQSAGWIQQVLKEWVIWAYLMWSGPNALAWVYDYKVEPLKLK